MTAVAFRPPWPPLGDDLVALRLWSPDDLDQLVEALRDPEIPRWTLMPDPYTRGDALEFLRGVPDHWRTGTGAVFCITPADRTEQVLGAIGLYTHPMHTAQAGYWVAAEARGRGVATRALRLVSAWAFEHTTLARLELTVFPGNTASMRVAEGAGYQREGLVRQAVEQRGVRRDAWLYSRLPDDPVPPLPTRT